MKYLYTFALLFFTILAPAQHRHNIRMDTTQQLDPFAGKSFKVGLAQIPLKYCEAFKSDWAVKIYAYWHVSSGKLYGIYARIYPASPITEGQVDAFVKTFERTE